MDKITEETVDVEKNSESLLSINQKKLKNEMIYMKEDLLKDLKNFERNFSEKLTKSNQSIYERLEEFEQKIEEFNQKLFQISQTSVEDKSIKEKIEKMSEEKMNVNDKILKMNVKLDNLEKKLIEKNDYIDKILNDSIIYPGIIGNKCKFVNFHEFIDYTLSQLAKYYVVTQKTAMELNLIKKKIDSNIKEVKSQFEINLASANHFSRKIFFESENKVKDISKVLENEMKILKEENEVKIDKISKNINDIKTEIKKEIEDKEKEAKKEKDNMDILILKNNKNINDLKISLEKINNEIKEIDNKINIDLQKKENIKEITNININNNNDSLNNDYENVVNKYINGEINEEQFLVYKQFNKLSLKMKNYLDEFLEKSAQSLKQNQSIKYKKSPSINLAAQLTSSFNNIISEITLEKSRSRTVNNLINCLELKLTKENGREKTESIFKRKNNIFKTDFKTINANNDLKIKTFDNTFNLIRNDSGFKTFCMSNKINNFRSINIENMKNNFNEEAKNNENYFVKELGNINKSFNKEILINNDRNNIMIDFDKDKNKDIKEYKNKITNIIQDKINVNKMRKGLIHSILNNNKENEYSYASQKNMIKDNIIKKINNNQKKEEELRQSKIHKILMQKKEIDQDKMNLSDFKSFRGKKYFGYEKSFDAKVKEKLISKDINYKEKMKKIKEGIHRDISYTPRYNIVLPKTKRYLEAENMEKMVNNLQSYLGENFFNINNNHLHFRKINIQNVSQSAKK